MSFNHPDLPINDDSVAKQQLPGKLMTVIKAIIIILLLSGIAFLALMQWKSDLIVAKAVDLIQSRMEDSLRYDDISLEWVRYFPNAAIRLEGLQVGHQAPGFVQGGNLDIVLRLWPLLNEKVIINELRITDSHINVTRVKGKWTYDLFKKSEPAAQTATIDKKGDNSSWEALIRQVSLNNTTVSYDDTEGMRWKLMVDKGDMKGNLSSALVDTEIKMTASLHDLTFEGYIQPQPFSFHLTGEYKRIDSTGHQEITNWRIEHEQIEMELNGQIKQVDQLPWMDMDLAWHDADPEAIKSFLPTQSIREWDAYKISGKSSGQLEVKGTSSGKQTPHIILATELKNGSIKFPGDGGQLKNMLLNMAYDSGDPKAKSSSYFRAHLYNASFQGKNLKGELRLDNLAQPLVQLNVKGAVPAGVLNFFMDPSIWHFREGVFDFDQYEIKGLAVKTISTKTLIQHSAGAMNVDNLRFSYHDDQIEILDTDVSLDAQGKMKLAAESIVLNKATGENIKGDLVFEKDMVEFDLTGKHSGGTVKTTGNVRGLGTKPVMESDWTISGIEMKTLLASFENFDQTFITSEHLNGKADIWAHSIIPYDASGNVLTKNVTVMAAIDIRDGALKGLKTLEDFGKYVHLEDLRDIRFNTFRNYMKIENGKVHLPVMFLQSSALNMSIHGVHTFDQEILYNLKINAGQTAANKLKKKDPLKKFKQARKSGWINLYFVLSGRVGDVKYEQDQRQVISAFEQSSQLKESLRKYLVDRFGHDVYWLEPNEWEDIPEYK